MFVSCYLSSCVVTHGAFTEVSAFLQLLAAVVLVSSHYLHPTSLRSLATDRRHVLLTLPLSRLSSQCYDHYYDLASGCDESYSIEEIDVSIYASVLFLMTNCVIALSKWLWNYEPQAIGSASLFNKGFIIWL